MALAVVTDDGARPAGVPQEEPEVMLKFVFEISKKMFPTDSILILAVDDGVFGMVTTSVPSLGVLAASTVEKVCPPSVDKEIFTLAQLTGAAVVPATAHVIVCDEPPAHDIAELGAVTEKGPAVPFTVTVMSVNCVWPTLTGAVERYTALSLTVNRKFRVLPTELKASVFAPASPPDNGPVTVPPANMVDS